MQTLWLVCLDQMLHCWFPIVREPFLKHPSLCASKLSVWRCDGRTLKPQNPLSIDSATKGRNHWQTISIAILIAMLTALVTIQSQLKNWQMEFHQTSASLPSRVVQGSMHARQKHVCPSQGTVCPLQGNLLIFFYSPLVKLHHMWWSMIIGV